jgi:hypothetical protein
MIELIDKAHDKAFNVMVEQMKVNPDAMEALYSNSELRQ